MAPQLNMRARKCLQSKRSYYFLARHLSFPPPTEDHHKPIVSQVEIRAICALGVCQKALRMKGTTTIALALCLIAASKVQAEEVLLSCWGTVEVIQQGKQVNPVDEKYSIAVAVDVSKKTLTINGITWPIAGDASHETIVAMDQDKGSVNLNRITGAVNVHFIEYNGLKKFYGKCKPAQKLF
jgi:hypothetical protein